MKVLITEEQYNLYIRRRHYCMKEYIDRLKSGEETLLIPPSSFKWDTYMYIITLTLRKHCEYESYNGGFNMDIHDDIMKLFGDELLEIYNNNK